MKKYLAFLLVLVMILSVSLAACSKKPAGNVDDDDDWGNGGGTTTPTVNDNNDDNNNNNDNPSNPWTDVSGSVYAGVNELNLRSEPNLNSANNILKKLNAGTEMTRTSTNGVWYKVTVGEGESAQEGYVLCGLVTTVGTNFEFSTLAAEDQKTLTVVGENKINLRWTPFVPEGDYAYSNVAIQEFKAENGTLTKIGVSESGNWYKVSFTGTIGEKTYDGTEVLYMAFSSVSAGYVNDPSYTGGGSGGGLG